ncbi:MAG: plasma-membrane proton-efflux P-type ATPase [Acidobacteria bacterium]|nr:plasma-membrane proton-efflux P-type ATPase [Acidobacteriota bacterium]
MAIARQLATEFVTGTDDNHKSINTLDAEFDTASEGLATSEVANRLERFGPNELPEHPRNVLRTFLSYFWGPIPWMIEAAAVLSAVVHHWADLAIILVLLVGNAVVGFWEEYQADTAIDALKSKLAPTARVRRDSAWRTIAARELVPGDLIRLRLGDVIPADARLRDDGELQVDQSALTGESLPVKRSHGDAVYSGSVLKLGESDATVIATGGDTFFGRTALLVEQSETVSHFQQAVLKIGDALLVLAAAMIALILLVALFRGDPIVTTLEFALVLTIAAIPVAMPAVLSVTMAVGARLLAAKNAIVSRLAAIEELAGMDVLCTDKTGTLTENKLSFGEPVVAPGVELDDVIRCAALASNPANEDPIDLAVLDEVPDDALLAGHRVTSFVPFDPVNKRTEATVADERGHTFKVSKGAPQAVLALVDDDDEMRHEMMATVDEFATRGYRSLGVARTVDGGRWRMLGVLPLYDPPRADSRETLNAARDLGIEVKMVTGDQMSIAREIARQVGLGTNIVDADRLSSTVHHQGAQLSDDIEAANGFAQVFPEHKHHIVDVLQKKGHITGMTGDGVNDAPALKKADCGIAVSGATDAARAAADIVLTNPGLSVIIDAIRSSRRIFQRMNSYAIYRIAETIRVLLFMTASILIFNFYPVTAAMIVLLALLNDGPILAIAFDRAEASEQPERWNMGRVLGVSSLLGIAGVVATFGLFFLAERVFHLDRATIQSLIFLKLAVAGHLTIFLTRTRGPFWSSRPAPALLWAAVATKVLATLAAVYGVLMNPIGWRWAGFVWGYSLVWFVVNDLIKRAGYRLFDDEGYGLLATQRASA